MNKDVTKSRFSDADWFKSEEEQFIHIIGQGGTGSWTALFLSRILKKGSKTILHLSDFDKYEEVNMAGQFVSNKDIDKNKAEASRDLLQQFSSLTVKEINIDTMKLDADNIVFYPIVFSCVDNMKLRKEAFENWIKYAKEVTIPTLFIDPRLEAEAFQVYCVTPDRAELYTKTLFDDSEVPDLACSLKQTSHIAAKCAATCVELYTNYTTNRLLGMDIRALPFSVKYNTMNLEQKISYEV